jgi:DNA-binding MarR family transcriptional regulator
MDIRKLSTYQAGIMQSSAHRAVGAFVANLLKPHGLTMMQWFVLGIVYDAGNNGARMTELTKQLDTTMAFVTNHINRLESMGLVSRKVHETDTRVRIVTIKPAGKKMVNKIETELRQGMRDGVYSLVSSEEMKTYLTVLYKLTSIDSNK